MLPNTGGGRIHVGFKSLELSAAVFSFLFFLIKEVATVCVQLETIK